MKMFEVSDGYNEHQQEGEAKKRNVSTISLEFYSKRASGKSFLVTERNREEMLKMNASMFMGPFITSVIVLFGLFAFTADCQTKVRVVVKVGSSKRFLTLSFQLSVPIFVPAWGNKY